MAAQTPRERRDAMRPINNLDLVNQICDASITLRESRRVHIRRFGTLVPHVFMADVLARIGVCLSFGMSRALCDHREEVQGILDILELGMAKGDRETRNVIAMSFVHDGQHEMFFDDLLPLLGARLKAQQVAR